MPKTNSHCNDNLKDNYELNKTIKFCKSTAHGIRTHGYRIEVTDKTINLANVNSVTNLTKADPNKHFLSTVVEHLSTYNLKDYNTIEIEIPRSLCCQICLYDGGERFKPGSLSFKMAT